VTPLDPTLLFTPCPATDLSFDTTTALEPQQAFPGQDRAVEAIEFGIGIRHEGYNLYAVGGAWQWAPLTRADVSVTSIGPLCERF